MQTYRFAFWKRTNSGVRRRSVLARDLRFESRASTLLLNGHGSAVAMPSDDVLALVSSPAQAV
jgi:hypothetical protein